MRDANLELLLAVFLGLLLSISAATDKLDVEALQSLYGALGSPPQLTGWRYGSVDPCGDEYWKGVVCSGQSVTAIKIGGQGIGGYLGLQLSKFQSLKELDVSNNSIGGEIPYFLPKNVTLMNLARNQFIMNLPSSLPTLTVLGHLNLSHNLLSGPIGNVFVGLKNLKEMDLSFNNLSGDLPSSFSSLTHLHGLYLQENQFTGSVHFLSDLPLSNLNIENNHFSGIIPKEFYKIPKLKIGGNLFVAPLLPPPHYANDTLPSLSQTPGNMPFDYNTSEGPVSSVSGDSDSQVSRRNKRRLGRRAIAGTISSAFIVALCAFIFFVMHIRKSHQSKLKRFNSMDNPLCDLPIMTSKDDQNHHHADPCVVGPVMSTVLHIKPERVSRRKSSSRRSRSLLCAKLYPALDLLMATNNFSKENLLGEGSLGRVYRAEFSYGQVLAVKKIDLVGLSICEEDEFLDVICNISRLKHPNIMVLRGYCVEQGQHILVYDYSINGSLSNMLHSDGETERCLPWKARVKIALGVARALEYLHITCCPPMAHGNLKPTNILLDDELMPHLGDCGLIALRILIGTKVKGSELPFGCTGYTAPEFGFPGADLIRSDIFSFGVLLLELLTGKMAFDSSRVAEEQSLVKWASSRLHDFGLFEAFVDPAIKGTFPSKALSQFADIILLCIQPQPEFRPPVTEISDMLVSLIQSMGQGTRWNSREGLELDPSHYSFMTTHTVLSSPVSV